MSVGIGVATLSKKNDGVAFLFTQIKKEKMNNKNILKDAPKIGIETLEQLQDFEKREKRQGETLAEALARYCRELGEETIEKLKTSKGGGQLFMLNLEKMNKLAWMFF